MSVMHPTIERAALDRLLAFYAGFDILEIDWQLRGDRPKGPWLIVTLGQRSDDRAEAWVTHTFAIWKETGAIHGMRHDGSVSDDPLPIR